MIHQYEEKQTPESHCVWRSQPHTHLVSRANTQYVAVPSPAPATTTAQLATVALANNAVGYAPSALAPDLEYNLQFSPGPVAAAAPGVPDWLVGTQQIGTNLFYVGDGQNQGFYTVRPSSYHIARTCELRAIWKL